MSTREPLWSLAFVRITLINLAIFMSFQLVNATIPVYAKSIGASDVMIGILLSSISIASISVRPFAGQALDRLGRRRVLLPALAVITVLIFSYGLFGTVLAMVILRFFHGLAWGVSSTATTTIASDVIPRKRFGEGMGFFTLSTSLALALAPAIGLAILEHFQFFATTSISAIFVFVAFLATFFIKERQQQEILSAKEKTALFEKSAFWPAVLMFFCTPCMSAIAGFVAVYAYSIQIHAVGPFFTIYALAMVLSRPMVGRMIDHVGFRSVVLSAFALMGIALFGLSQMDGLFLFYFAGLCFGIGFAAAQTSFQTMTVLRAPAGRTGAANATFFMGFDAGIAIGGILAGAIAHQIGYANMYLCLIGLLLLATVFFLRFGSAIKR